MNSFSMLPEKIKLLTEKFQVSPISISSVKTIFEKSVSEEKLLVGPTALRPGPTLLTQVITEESVLVKFKIIKEIRAVETAITAI